MTTSIETPPIRDERDRPQVMFLWIWWFVFNPVVLFLAPSFARRARRLGFRETARYWVPFWLTLGGYVVGAIVIALVLTNLHSYSSAVYSSGSGGSGTHTTATTTAQDPLENHSRVQEDLFPPVVPLANDPQARRLEALMIADGNNQYGSASDAHCLQKVGWTAPSDYSDISGTVTAWNCDIKRTESGRQPGDYEYTVAWNGGSNPPGDAHTPPDWIMYQRTS